MFTKHPAFKLMAIAAFLCTCVPILPRAENTLPPLVRGQANAKAPLTEVGSGIYRKFGLRIYRATLWAPAGVWNATAPYALELHYLRDISKDTLIDTVIDDIRDQNITSDVTLASWQKTLENVLPEIADGDTLIGLSRPGKSALLFHNGGKIASLDDAAFSKAFFNIWLGDGADEDLRADLLGHK